MYQTIIVCVFPYQHLRKGDNILFWDTRAECLVLLHARRESLSCCDQEFVILNEHLKCVDMLL